MATPTLDVGAAERIRSIRRTIVTTVSAAALAIGLTYGWLWSQTEDVTFIDHADVDPVVPGEAVSVDVRGQCVGPLLFGYERAPLGRWFWSHTGAERVADNWWWPRDLDRGSPLPAFCGPISVVVPPDARGSVYAVCDIGGICLRIPLAG